MDISKLVEGKVQARKAKAALSFEEKVAIVVQLQEIAKGLPTVKNGRIPWQTPSETSGQIGSATLKRG